MRILHYYLGPAPLRSGGLTKYVEDLMEAEKLNGDTCLQLYPLKLTSNKRIHISKTRDSKVYQLVNAYPLPLTGGIKTPEDFWGGDVDVSGIRQFLKHIAVDIIHIPKYPIRVNVNREKTVVIPKENKLNRFF